MGKPIEIKIDGYEIQYDSDHGEGHYRVYDVTTGTHVHVGARITIELAKQLARFDQAVQDSPDYENIRRSGKADRWADIFSSR